MAGRIYCIMGKSASGKDTVYRELLKRLPDIGTYVMYTTRPIRSGETDGISYHFVDEKQIEVFRKEGKLIESRTYQTMHGPWTYATVDDGQICKDRDILMPATLESYIPLLRYYGEEVVVPLYIEVEDGLRLERALQRERTQKEPKYAELCRRFLADAEDFSEDKLKEAGICRRYENNELSACVEEIIKEINH